MVERSPEKAGVGGSIPSLATVFDYLLTLRPGGLIFHYKIDARRSPLSVKTPFGILAPGTILL